MFILTGVVGISAVWANAKEVAFTDGAIEVLRIAKDNIENNLDLKLSNGDCNQICSSFVTTTTRVGLGRLRWGNEDDIRQWLQWNGNKLFDFVVASEVAYEHRSVELLLNTIKQLVDPVQGIVIIRG